MIYTVMVLIVHLLVVIVNNRRLHGTCTNIKLLISIQMVLETDET